MPLNPAKPFDLEYRVDPTWSDMRLDRFLRVMIPSISRTKLQRYIQENRVEVNCHPRPANWRVRTGDTVLLKCNIPEDGDDAGKYIRIDTLYEDDDILVVNKQPGLIVHPVSVHRHNTLLNALYWKYKDILPKEQEISLANRLDQYTSGVILVTKHSSAKRIIQEQFEKRSPKKTYLALVDGIIESDSGSIDAPIGSTPVPNDRCLRGVRYDDEGKPCLSHYSVMERFKPQDSSALSFTLVQLEPYTGRQHQLRVHMAHIGHPMVCDYRYGNPSGLSVNGAVITRYALHAESLSFIHPIRQAPITVNAPLPDDLNGVLSNLRSGFIGERVNAADIACDD